jgi:hypothetical protein
MKPGIYEIGDLVSVVDNWWDSVDTRQVPALLPLESEIQKLYGIIVDKEIYPAAINASPHAFLSKHNGLYHVLLTNGKVKKYFHNRLDKMGQAEESGVLE